MFWYVHNPEAESPVYVHKFVIPPGSSRVFDKFEDVRDWCEEQFGSPGTRWRVNTWINRFYLSDPDDAFHFRMRWC